MQISSKDIKDTASTLSGSFNGIYWTVLLILGALNAYGMYLMNADRDELKEIIKQNQEIVKDTNQVIRENISILNRIDSKLDLLTKK